MTFMSSFFYCFGAAALLQTSVISELSYMIFRVQYPKGNNGTLLLNLYRYAIRLSVCLYDYI